MYERGKKILSSLVNEIIILKCSQWYAAKSCIKKKKSNK